MPINDYEIGKVKSLLLKGFSKEEVAKLMDIDIIELKDINLNEDVTINSFELYNDLQKDLAKLVLKEMNKDNNDPSVILNAIKMQADMQERKLQIMNKDFTKTNVNNNYMIKDRDLKIKKLTDEGKSKEDIAKEFSISNASISNALDRCNLALPNELWDNISPTIITETIGLDKDTRVKIITEAYNQKYSKYKVREIVNRIKNERI